MSIEVYESIRYLEDAPLTKLELVPFIGVCEDIKGAIPNDKEGRKEIGLPVKDSKKTDIAVAGENFYEDFEEAIEVLKGVLVGSSESIETNEIDALIDETRQETIGITEGIASMETLASEEEKHAVKEVALIAQGFVSARALAKKSFVEKASIITDELLQAKSAIVISAFSPRLIASLKKVESNCKAIKALYHERGMNNKLHYTEEKRAVCVKMIRYLEAKALTKLNLNDPNATVVKFADTYDMIMREAKKAYNIHKAHIPKEDEPTVEENIQAIKIDVADIKEELL